MSHRAAASFVATTPTVSAFMDINPVTPGHLLVVTNDHLVGLADTPESVMADVMRLGQRCAAAIRSSRFRSDGVNLFLADGAAAMQEVFHLHLHVIPRYAGDSFRIRVDRGAPPGRAELDSAAGELSSVLPNADGLD